MNHPKNVPSLASSPFVAPLVRVDGRSACREGRALRHNFPRSHYELVHTPKGQTR